MVRPMSAATHRRIALARRPEGVPIAQDFRLETTPLPAMPPGGLLVRNLIVSLDAGIRGWMNAEATYMEPMPLGDTVRGMTLGQVIASDAPAHAPGTLVRAMAGWEEVSALPSDAIGLEPVTPAPGVPIEHYMGALGPGGLTAWIGLHDIGGLTARDTVLVSAAAGAVGCTVGQIARAAGARTIGIAGGAAKAAKLADLGFDHAIDHRAATDLTATIRAAAPAGVTLYFDNVGGPVLEAVLPAMAQYGRIVACGMISEYNDAEHPYGVRTLWHMVARRLTMRGFFTYDDPARIAPAQAGLETLFATGALVPFNAVREGIDAVPHAFIDLMAGRTMGKTLVRLGERS